MLLLALTKYYFFAPCRFGVTSGDLVNCEMKSMGTGKMMVEFFSVAIELSVWYT